MSFKITNKNKKKGCASLWNLYHRKTFFIVDVSINKITGGTWQTNLVIWKVTQIHLLHQESVNKSVGSGFVWASRQFSCLHLFQASVQCMTFSPDGKCLATAGTCAVSYSFSGFFFFLFFLDMYS